MGADNCWRKLIISENGNNRILIYNSIPSSNNASADVVIGQDDFVGGGRNHGLGDNPDEWGLNLPMGVFYDEVSGKLIVNDQNNYRWLIFNKIPEENGASADVVIGQPDFNTRTSNRPLSTKDFAYPGGYGGIPHVIEGRLYIPDSYNNRIIVFNSIPNENYAEADFVLGQPDFTSRSINAGGTPGPNTLYFPVSMFYDGKKTYVNDAQNNRILIFHGIPTQDNFAADVVIGQPDFT